MPIKPVTGKIEAQELNDNFSYLESRKLEKGSVSVHDFNKNLGKLDQTFMTDEFLQQMAGNTPINSVPADNSLTKKKFAFPIVEGVKSKNLFIKDTATPSAYINYSTGQMLSSTSNYYASEYIEIIPNETYALSGYTQTQQLAFYDINKNYISGIAEYSSTLTAPSNAKFMRITVRKEGIETFQFERNTSPTTYEQGGTFIEINRVKGLEKELDFKKTITVKKDGSGDYTNLRAALDFANSKASKSSQYSIEMYEGDYDVFSNYTLAEIQNTSFFGPMLNDYVHLMGVGDFRKIRLIGRLDSATVDSASQNRVSPLNMKSLCNVENVTVIGRNTRYAIHDDYNTAGIPARRNYKNVHAYKEAGNGQAAAYGAGCLSGAIYEFDNFIATSEIGTPFSLHNLNNFTNRCKFVINRLECHNIGMSSASDPRYKFSVDFPSEMSNTNDEIIMTGCYIPDGIHSRADTGQFGFNTTGQIDFTIKGYGNTIAPNLITHSDGGQYYIDFNEEVTRHIASAAITKGQPLKFSERGKVVPMSSSDSSVLFMGVALTDALAGEEVVIKYKGYLHKNDTQLTNFVVGDKIGISNGSLEVVTNGDTIGKCILVDYILLN